MSVATWKLAQVDAALAQQAVADASGAEK